MTLSEYYIKSQTLQEIIQEILGSIIKDEATKYIEVKTNLSCGLPLKDIHKIAGPLVDEWAYEKLLEKVGHSFLNGDFKLINVISKSSSSLEDILLQAEYKGELLGILIDVKSASLEKGNNAGKGSNITSFRKIRPFYVNNPNAYFIILSIKHKAYINEHGVRQGFEIIGSNVFDLKLVVCDELKFNKRMGDQFQITNSMKVNQIDRSTDEFIELLDQKYVDAYSEQSLAELLNKIEESERFLSYLNQVIDFMRISDRAVTKKEIKNYLNVEDALVDKIVKKARDNELINSPKRGYYAILEEELPEGQLDIFTI